MNGYNMCLLKTPVRPLGWACSHSLLPTGSFCLRKGFLAFIKWQEWCKFAIVKEALNWFAFIYLHIHRTAKSKKEKRERKQTFSQHNHSIKPSQWPWEAATHVSSFCYPLIYSQSVCPWGVSLDFPVTNGWAQFVYCVAQSKLLMSFFMAL